LVETINSAVVFNNSRF